MEADTFVGTTDPQPDCDEAEGSFTLCPVHTGEYLQVLPCQPSGNPATQQARKKDLQQESITTVYIFPSSLQGCLMLGATVSPPHRAVSQTLHLVGFSPALPQQEIF